MKKNVAGQKIGAQLVSAADGSAFTGSVTVAVTVDAGTQATGSVGSGACTHKGGGYHTYSPSQAETNGDLVAFTFSGTGAVPVTIQLYTRPTTGLLAPTIDGRTLDVSSGGEAGIDWANVGSPTATLNLSGTTISTSQSVAAVTLADNAITAAKIAGDAITAAKIATDAVTEIQSGLATASALSTVSGYIDTEVAAIKAKTDNLPSDPADASDIAAAFGTVNSTLSTIAAYIDTEIGAIKAKTDNLPSNTATELSAISTLLTLVKAILGNKHNVTDNGNGTFSIAVRNDADSATVLTITYNPATGARTVA